MTTGEKIRTLRKEKGLTIKEMSEQSGIAATQISSYENSRSRPQSKVRNKLAEFFGKEAEYFKDDSTDTNSSSPADADTPAPADADTPDDTPEAVCGKATLEIQFAGRTFDMETLSKKAREVVTALGCNTAADIRMVFTPMDGMMRFECDGLSGSFSM